VKLNEQKTHTSSITLDYWERDSTRLTVPTWVDLPPKYPFGSLNFSTSVAGDSP